MVDRSAIGVTGPVYEFVVEKGKVREFAHATKSTDPAHLDAAEPLIPATFLTIAGRFWGYTFDSPGDTDLARIDVDRNLLLNAEEEFEFFGPPPRAGQRLLAQTGITDVFTKQGRRGGLLTFIVTETTFRSESGDAVAALRQTIVQTEKAPDAD